MSYDLFFFKQKGSAVTDQQITRYLNESLLPINEHGNQWFYENEETEVYYSFERTGSEEAASEDEFDDFENTRIAFNVNFNRPCFFGLEAFGFVERFINELGIYVVNPQGDTELPCQPTKQELYDNWNHTNLWASKDLFDEKSGYFPVDKSNWVWQYNFNRKRLQEKVGYEYFVSKIFFFREMQTNKVVTLSMWAEHIPNILPKTDYYLLGREYKKLFRTVKDEVLLTDEAFKQQFGTYFEPFEGEEAYIIHPDTASKIGKVFNSVTSTLSTGKDIQRIAADSIVNVEPEKTLA